MTLTTTAPVASPARRVRKARKWHFRSRFAGRNVEITPRTQRVRAWIEENFNTEPHEWIGNVLSLRGDRASALILSLDEAGFRRKRAA